MLFWGSEVIVCFFPSRGVRGLTIYLFSVMNLEMIFFWLVNRVANVLHVFLIILASTLQFPNPLAEIYLCWPSSSFEISLELYCHTDFLAWKFTPPKTNMSPKKVPFPKESSLPTMIFWGTCLFSGGVFPLSNLGLHWQDHQILGKWIDCKDLNPGLLRCWKSIAKWIYMERFRAKTGKIPFIGYAYCMFYDCSLYHMVR